MINSYPFLFNLIGFGKNSFLVSFFVFFLFTDVFFLVDFLIFFSLPMTSIVSIFFTFGSFSFFSMVFFRLPSSIGKYSSAVFSAFVLSSFFLILRGILIFYK